MLQIIEDKDNIPLIKLDISQMIAIADENKIILVLSKSEDSNDDIGIFEIFRNLFKGDGE